MPRDVAPDVGNLDQVFLYNIDDLQGIVDANMRTRVAEAERAAALLEGEIDGFVGWQRSRSVGPVIQRLHAHARAVADSELARLGGRFGEMTPSQRKAVESLAHGIVRKLLHHPVTSLRQSAQGDETYAANALVEAVETLFDLEEKSADPPAEEGAAIVAGKPVKSSL